MVVIVDDQDVVETRKVLVVALSLLTSSAPEAVRIQKRRLVDPTCAAMETSNTALKEGRAKRDRRWEMRET